MSLSNYFMNQPFREGHFMSTRVHVCRVERVRETDQLKQQHLGPDSPTRLCSIPRIGHGFNEW